MEKLKQSEKKDLLVGTKLNPLQKRELMQLCKFYNLDISSMIRYLIGKEIKVLKTKKGKSNE